MANTIPAKCPFETITNPEQEAQQITETADLTGKLLDKRYPPPKQVLRGVHPKSHGCVSAMFTIDAKIPPHLQVGLFAAPGKEFRAIIRFSNAEALVGPDIKDGQHGSRGMAIKVLDVDGDILDEDGGAHNQDFLMINQPSFVFANTEDYLRLTRILDKDSDVGSRFFALLSPAIPEQAKEAFMQAEGISPEAAGRIPTSFGLVQMLQATPVANPLGVRYFSAAPFLFGPDRVMKFSVKPCQVVPPSEVPTSPADNYLGDALTQAMLGQTSLQFEFGVQVRGADADLGVENACTIWDEATYPFVKVADITIPTPQPEIGTAAHQAHCESLVFTPWHSLAAHQPIGSINRLRRPVYQASAERRGTGLVRRDAGLLFYDTTLDQYQFFSTDGQGGMAPIGAARAGSRKTWSSIVPGDFGVGTTTSLWFYDGTTGEYRFFSTDGQGSMAPIGGVQTMRKTWSRIVPGNFGGGATTDIFFYDASNGEYRFFSPDGKGGMALIGAAQPVMRKTWWRVVPGNFSASTTTDLLFYDLSLGEYRFFSTDGQGKLVPLGGVHTGARKTWSHVVPGHFGASTTTSLFFYDASLGEYRIFSTDGQGNMAPLGGVQTMRKTWSLIVPGRFGGGTKTSLFFYDAAAGEGRFFGTDGDGTLNPSGSPHTMRKTWSRVIPGMFLPG